MNEQGYKIEIQARYQGVEIDAGFWDWLKNEADAIFLYVNGSDESFDTIKQIVADVVLHVGTHGLLEFLPGKGAGLSTECYPQISIGSMPHLYIYSITNPMEAIIAKRRGYATMVDHLLPVMSPSGLYEGLEDLSDLLAEYGKAQSTNDSAPAGKNLANLRDECGASFMTAFISPASANSMLALL